MNQHRACGRLDCTDCPKFKVGRCKATPQQRVAHECSCAAKEQLPSTEQRCFPKVFETKAN